MNLVRHVNGKTIFAAASPLTQSAEAVKQLIAYQTYGREPSEMPPFYRLGCEMVLVKSSKGDAYYVTTPRACSCPSAAYRPGQLCKHSRNYFPLPKGEGQSGEATSVRITPLTDIIRPEGKWQASMNEPTDSDSLAVVV